MKPPQPPQQKIKRIYSIDIFPQSMTMRFYLLWSTMMITNYKLWTSPREKALKILKSRDIRKAMCPESLSPWVLKNCARELTGSLSLCFSKSMEQGVFLRDWLSANVIPMYKKGDKSEVSNYRPVSLLCIAGKFMERIVVDSIFPSLEK